MTQQSRIPGVFTTQQAPARSPIFYDVDVSQIPFVLDYKGRNYVYVYPLDTIIVTLSGGYGQATLLGTAWQPLIFPQGTQISIPGQVASDHLIIQCTDVPIPTIAVLRPRVESLLFSLQKQVVTSFSTGILNAGTYSELVVDFTVYTITGGSAPTVTFRVARQGIDGQLYTLEQATALSVPGAISYSIGAGLDGKAFGGNFQVDMILTGNPTSVQISGSIKAKQ